jgi:hypothetical protein
MMMYKELIAKLNRMLYYFRDQKVMVYDPTTKQYYAATLETTDENDQVLGEGHLYLKLDK